MRGALHKLCPYCLTLQVSHVEFEKLIEYDNKCFISQNFPVRREFLRQWTQIPGGATYVALSDATGGHVVGYGCRRPAARPVHHELGPLYADNSEIAEALLSKLCTDVVGDDVIADVW